jgi:MoxR-like ATPase
MDSNPTTTNMTTGIEEEKLAQATRITEALRREIGKAVVGQQSIVDETLIALIGAGHVLIEGVPGLGKTLLVKALARTFDGSFSRIQFTPDLMPSDVTGHTLYDPKSGDFTTRKGPVFANLLLADEINRAPAKTQAALLEVMQEAQVTIEATPHPLPTPFMVLATQNPIEQEGTYPLPEAQLDRFLLKVRIDYPTLEEESALVRSVTSQAIGDKLNVESVATIVKPETILALQRLAAGMTVDIKVLEYAVRIARETRDFAGFSSGAGPRGAIAMVRAARGHALLNGRGFVTPDDVKRMALPVLRHRVTPSPEMEIEGRDVDDLLRDLFEQVEAPRV